MKKWSKERLVSILLAVGILISPINGKYIFAAENTAIKLSQTGSYFATVGDSGVNLTMKVENKGGAAVTFAAKTGLHKDTGSITEPKPSSAKIILEAGQSAEILFVVDISNMAKPDTYRIPVVLADSKDGSVLRSGELELRVIKKSVSPGASGDDIVYSPAFDLVHNLKPQDFIKGGAVTDLSLSFINSGNTVMKNALVTLGMPEGITINNGSSSLSVGYVDLGESKNVKFSLVADEKMDSKNYPFTFEIEFKDQKNATQSIKQTIYIPVQGKGSASLANIDISNINLPKQVLAGEDFALNFKVGNKGESGSGQIKVYTETQSGINNRTQNTFIEKNIAAGESRNYSIDFFTTERTEETGYTIKIIVESLSDNGDGIEQYTSIYVKNTGTDSIKTPQLMVSGYSFGGSSVQAGDEFRLDLTLNNTSEAHNLRNIKVTLESADGTFIPVRSSNSFFISRIGKRESTGHTMYLSVKPDAEQKTTSVNISMSYEDSEGNSFTSNDVISIPVMQDTRLVVDDVISPPELYAGMPSGVSVDFYNMGKTKLNNLRINAEGNFDTMESNNYYVGNMEPGVEDTYDFSFIPMEVGLMSGKIIFTYEDAKGDQQTYEKEFEFQIMEMPNWDDEFFPPEDMNGQGGKIPWLPIGIVAVVLAIVAFLLIRRHRKKKMLREMEIDE
jgi:hypothetical protein